MRDWTLQEVIGRLQQQANDMNGHDPHHPFWRNLGAEVDRYMTDIVLESGEADLLKSARQAFSLVDTGFQMPNDATLVFWHFFRFWRCAKKYISEPEAIPKFSTARLQASMSMRVANKSGQEAIVINPTWFEIQEVGFSAIAPYCIKGNAEYCLDKSAEERFEIIKRNPEGVKKLIEIIGGVLSQGKPPQLKRQGLRKGEQEAFLGGMFSAGSNFLIGHELTHSLEGHSHFSKTPLDFHPPEESFLCCWPRDLISSNERLNARHRNEIMADIGGYNVATTATDDRYAYLAATITLLLCDVVEFWATKIKGDCLVLDSINPHAHRINALYSKRDHPPPIYRWWHLTQFVREVSAENLSADCQRELGHYISFATQVMGLTKQATINSWGQMNFKDWPLHKSWKEIPVGKLYPVVPIAPLK